MTLRNTRLLIYAVKFLGLFALLFYGTEAIIGLSAPVGKYNAFVAHHLNFIDPLRRFLLTATQKLLSVLGFQTILENSFTLSFVDGKGIRMVYSCIGYGILSFWIAFVFANDGRWKKKLAWMIAGCLALCGINIIRISLLLVAIKKGWAIPLGWDHHTWFTIAAYGLIFWMMVLFDRAGKKQEGQKHKKQTKEPEIQMNTINPREVVH